MRVRANLFQSRALWSGCDETARNHPNSPELITEHMYLRLIYISMENEHLSMQFLTQNCEQSSRHILS